MVGLIAAVNRYDDSFGKSFESFAIPTIIGEIKRYIRDKRGVSMYLEGLKS